MAISQVIFNNSSLIDLTGDTVTPEGLQKGLTAHAANGETIVGTGSGGGSDISNLSVDDMILIEPVYNGQIPINIGREAFLADTFSKAFDYGTIAYLNNSRYELIASRSITIGKNIHNYHALLAGIWSNTIMDGQQHRWYRANGINIPNNINAENVDASYMFADDCYLWFDKNSSHSMNYYIDHNYLNNLNDYSFIIPNYITNTAGMFRNCFGLSIPVVYSDNILNCSFMFYECGYHRDRYNYDTQENMRGNKWYGYPLKIPNNAIDISGFYMNSTYNFTGIDKIIIPKSVKKASYLFAYLNKFANYDNFKITSIEFPDDVEDISYAFYMVNNAFTNTLNYIHLPNNVVNMAWLFGSTSDYNLWDRTLIDIPKGTNNNTFSDTVRNVRGIFTHIYNIGSVFNFFTDKYNLNIIGENVDFGYMFNSSPLYTNYNILIKGNNLNCNPLISNMWYTPPRNVVVNGNDINISGFYTYNRSYSYQNNYGIRIKIYGNNIDASNLYSNINNNSLVNSFEFKGHNINLSNAFRGSNLFNGANTSEVPNIIIPLTNLNNINMAYMFANCYLLYRYANSIYTSEISGDNINLYASNIAYFINWSDEFNIKGNNIVLGETLSIGGYIANLNIFGNNISYESYSGKLYSNININIIGNDINIEKAYNISNFNNVNMNIVGNNIYFERTLFSFPLYNTQYTRLRSDLNLSIIGNNINTVGLMHNFNYFNNNIGYHNLYNGYVNNYYWNVYIRGQHNLNLHNAFLYGDPMTLSGGNLTIVPLKESIGFQDCDFSGMCSYSTYQYRNSNIFPNGKIIGNNLNLCNLVLPYNNTTFPLYIQGDDINSYWLTLGIDNNVNINRITINGNNITFCSESIRSNQYYRNNLKDIVITGNNINVYSLTSNLNNYNINVRGNYLNMGSILTNSSGGKININIHADNSYLATAFYNLYNIESSKIDIIGNNINLSGAFGNCNANIYDCNIIGNNIDASRMFYTTLSNTAGTLLRLPSNIRFIGNDLNLNALFYNVSYTYTPMNLYINGNNLYLYGLLYCVGSYFRGFNNLYINGKNINYSDIFAGGSGMRRDAAEQYIYINNAQGIDNKTNMVYRSYINSYNLYIYCKNAENIINALLWKDPNIGSIYDIKGMLMYSNWNGDYSSIGWQTIPNGYYNSSYRIVIYTNAS